MYPYRQQQIECEGETVRIKNVRDFHYHIGEYFEEQYYDRTYDVNDLVRANYVITGFKRPLNVLFAHVFVTFEFKNNVFLSVSPEAGRSFGDPFLYYKALTYKYPLIYVFADEYDLIRARTNIFKFDSYMYPMKLSKEQARQLFVSIIDRAQGLARTSEPYHLIRNSCISELYKHINGIQHVHVPAGIGKLFPAWLDYFAFRRKFFDVTSRWWNLRYRHRITELGKQFDAKETYSLGIRNRLS